jgi:hypothetical protein
VLPIVFALKGLFEILLRGLLGEGDGDGVPKRRRVDENKRDGSLLVDEN